jgi:GT2 family glycosyltransferase
MKQVDISIVVCGYKSEDTIVPFLNSIKNSKDGLIKEIIVVDNYPADNGADLAKKHILKPLVIQNNENVGFSKAINQGVREAKGKYILIINPDTEIKSNTLKLLFDFAEEHPTLGAVVPKLLNKDGKVQPSVFMFPSITIFLDANTVLKNIFREIKHPRFKLQSWPPFWSPKQLSILLGDWMNGFFFTTKISSFAAG